MEQRNFAFVLWLTLATSVPGVGQVVYRPTPPPGVNAADRSWYAAREPIFFAGDLYYPAGPTIYFDGYRMVPTGSYDGVTLYADTTLEPYSVIFVPVGSSLTRPYERRRAGEIAGTTGSYVPWLPVQPAGTTPLLPEPAAGTSEAPAARIPMRSADTESPAGGTVPHVVVTTLKPAGNDGVWIEYEGHRWRSAGRAVATSELDLTKIGEYRGFPVYAARNEQGPARLPSRIFLPTLEGVAAPYDRVGPK